jgi:hypothetical protein
MVSSSHIIIKTSKIFYHLIKNIQIQQGIPTGETKSQILVLNPLEVSGREITDILGLVQGHTIFA